MPCNANNILKKIVRKDISDYICIVTVVEILFQSLTRIYYVLKIK